MSFQQNTQVLSIKILLTPEDVKNRQHHIHMNGREVFKHAVEDLKKLY